MSLPEHLERLRAGRKAWNAWRRESSERPDLSGEQLTNMNLRSFDLGGADLRNVSFIGSSLRRANLVGANLTKIMARFVTFSEARLADARLAKADLRAASLRRADLTRADLTRTVLRFTSMVGATVTDAVFREAEVYGISAWNLQGEPGDQTSLIIRENNDSDTITTTVDDLDTAQYLFMLRENTRIADVIDTASERTVLLLGRFAPRYKKVLDAVRQHLLEMNFVPVLFDFRAPGGRDLTETVASLAHMACFVIPDLSGAKSVPQELSYIVPFLPSVPVVPIISESAERAYSMFEHFLRYPWVRKPVRYRDIDHLLSIIDREVIKPGFQMAMKARGKSGARLPSIPKALRAR